ncbi:MAG: molybdate ABC transporter substrate-binding protein [Maricaulis sp.]|nr:molybdate ABC transporter substrate-binding protein [Maricaulis sp.]|tara:strand:+ start:7 stop:753 length:747 start_codon:yes stop_codon:yes gene_type:complete
MRALACLILAAGLSLSATARAASDEVLIAVATNFARPAEDLAARFEAETGHTVRIAAGSTGGLYAQIRQGAPYDVFLAADADRPARLVDDGLALPDTLTSYAFGRLVLIARPALDSPPLDRLHEGQVQRLALANADIAPYGRAAEQILDRLEIDRSRLQVLRGQSVAQALAIFTTGNADMALIARSQLGDLDTVDASLIPADWHAPVRQDAVILNRASDNPAAHAWMVFLDSATAAELLDSYGYGTGE